MKLKSARPNPLLETERLVLRLFEEADFEGLFAITCHPETFRFSERGPMGSDEAWGRLLRNIGHWRVKGFGMFAVLEKESGRLLGEAGVADFHRNLGADFDQVPEASWTIAPWAQMRGYATEAVGAALSWAGADLGCDRTVCLIHTRNEPSLRVAEKVGFRPFRSIKYKGYPARLLERLDRPFDTGA